jgi:DNA-binding transcriptional MerR regulator
MMRIGEFSKLCRVPVKTLRYYDEVGLFHPAGVDESSGYRHYRVEQLARINRILALKDLGFSLDEIGRMISDDLSLEELQGMLKLRRAEIRQAMQREGERLERVEGSLWRELEAYLDNEGVSPSGPCLSVYHDDEYKERDWDIEVCEPIAFNLSGTDRVNVYELPKVEAMACVLHHGPFVTINEVYNAIMRWISENGYRIIGPAREVYMRSAEHGSQEDPDTVTEIQFPVQKL